MSQGQQYRDPLRVGIIIDTWELDAWKIQAIRDVLACEFVQPHFLKGPVSLQDWASRKLNPLHWPFLLYETLDRLAFSRKSGLTNAFKKIAADFSERYPLLETEVWTQRAETDAHDLWINLSNSSLPDAITAVPRYGVWSLNHGNPPLFHDMREGNPTCQTRLEARLASGNAVLYESTSKTHAYSLFLSRNEPYWKATRFITRCLQKVHTHGLESQAAPPAQPRHSGMPNPLETLSFLTRVARGYFQNIVDKKLHRYQYLLAYKAKGGSVQTHTQSQFQVLEPPASEFWADPFVIEADNEHFVFFENYPYATHKGVISYLKLPVEKTATPQLALECDYHLSYPFLFKHDGAIYMIPETAGNRTIELYKATDFPHEWTLEKILMDNVSAHDVTLLAHNGKFWLFANMVETGGSPHDELFIFYSDSLFGDWQPHAGNPVISNVATARPAGRIFIEDGMLIRPSQDCTKRYGYALNFNRIEILTEADYQETLLTKLRPDEDAGFKGLHTYNANYRYEFIDLARNIPRQWPGAQAFSRSNTLITSATIREPLPV